MAVTFQISDVSIVQDYEITLGEAAMLLKPGTRVVLYDLGPEKHPELLGVLTQDGKELGVVPSDICFELREITSSFDELNAEITKIEKMPGLKLCITVCLHDFSWDESTGIPILTLTTDNPLITPAKGTFEHNIYKSKLEMKKLSEEADLLMKNYNASKRRR